MRGGLHMQYAEFRDGIRLSRLGMGNMRLPVLDQPGQPIDHEKAKAIIDEAMRQGINYYDTAYIYHNGESESFLGKALAEYPRNSFYIADKFNFQAQPDFRKQFDEQLERLQTDYIDFYMLHGIQDNFVDDILPSGCIEYFDELRKQGKIRYLGFSFHASVDNLKKMLKAYRWDFVQIQLNYYDWEYGNQRALYEILAEANIPVMVMEPVRGGLLAKLNPESKALLEKADPSASPASWALRWVKSLPAVCVILSGMGDLDMLADNVRTISESPDLSEKEMETVRNAAALLRREISLPCTGCRYCVPNCPKGLDIPSLLIAYNDYKSDSAWRLMNLFGLPEENRPSACINCGKCTAHCPQGLSVPAAMEEMAKIMNEMASHK